MRYQRFTVGGGHKSPEALLSFLNEMPRGWRALAINQGKYGRWDGLDGENEAGYEIIVDTGYGIPLGPTETIIHGVPDNDWGI